MKLKIKAEDDKRVLLSSLEPGDLFVWLGGGIYMVVDHQNDSEDIITAVHLLTGEGFDFAPDNYVTVPKEAVLTIKY